MDISSYEQLPIDGEVFVVIMEMPLGKIVAAKLADILGGATAVPLHLIERPA